VYGLLPVEVLLVVSFGELVGVEVFDVPGSVGGGFKEKPQGPTWLISNRPFDTLHFGRLAAVVAGAADLGPYTRGEMSRPLLITSAETATSNLVLRLFSRMGFLLQKT
jgi:hypothetical protein